jgi:hypothetical protein
MFRLNGQAFITLRNIQNFFYGLTGDILRKLAHFRGALTPIRHGLEVFRELVRLAVFDQNAAA